MTLQEYARVVGIVGADKLDQGQIEKLRAMIDKPDAQGMVSMDRAQARLGKMASNPGRAARFPNGDRLG